MWNMSFSCRFDRPELLCKLLIPSVVCGTGARWFSHRTWALRMAVMSPFILRCDPSWNLADERAHFARQAATLRPSVARAGFVWRTVEDAFSFALTNTTLAVFKAIQVAEWWRIVCSPNAT